MALRARRAARALVVTLVLSAGSGALPAPATATEPATASAAGPEQRQLTGTYEVLAKDRLDDDGHLDHVYTEVLRVPGEAAIPVRLPAGHGLSAGTRIRVAATGTTRGRLDVTSYQRLAPASTLGTAGTTSVLVILAHWNKPDAVTPARAAAQFFGDDDKWFREVSYGQAGLAGVVTPWVRIAGPSSGCYTDAELLLSQAMSAARRLGTKYDATYYQRTVLYFPTCGSADTYRVAGWAYEPGTVSWLNGAMDRRTTVHEQGHNYGLGHARSLACTSASGTRVTLSRTCSTAEYGDPFDAMGRASYVAHFSGYRKDRAGWLGGSRKRVLRTSSATFTLPPFERPSSLPVVVVARSPVRTRSYWLEYRRPVGMDARLPAGATGGVLVHVEDTGRPGVLLDASPRDATMSTAVVKPGQTWTAPDYVRVKVGTISATGARVTVTGARPPPVAPGAPQALTASPGDLLAKLAWEPPASDGGEAVQAYDIRLVSADHTVQATVTSGIRAHTVRGLRNDTTYAVSVRARNSAGSGPAAVASVRPYEPVPSVRITSPAAGGPLSGAIRIEAEALVNPDSLSPIRCVDFLVDDRHVGTRCPSYERHTRWTTFVDLDTRTFTNGDHRVSATVSDYANRYAGSEPVPVRFANQVPDVVITAPVHATAYDDVEHVDLEATATMPAGSEHALTGVYFYDATDGWERMIAKATSPSPGVYRFRWNVGTVHGTRDVLAVATASNGTAARSLRISVTVGHPPTEARVTAPADGASARGPTVPLAAEVSVAAAGSAVSLVRFVVDGVHVADDTTAPYEVTWDTSAVTGRHHVQVVVWETTGRVTTSPASVVTVDNVLPVVQLVGPTHYAHVGPGTVALHGTARPGGEHGELPDRVVVTVQGIPTTVPVAADGTWSLAYETGTRYGSVYWSARAYTPSGLASAHPWSRFTVDHPVPVATLDSPAPDSTLAQGSTVEIVVSARPADGDRAAVQRVCAGIGYHAHRCDGTPDADGRYRIAYEVSHAPGSYRMQFGVWLDDGYYFSYDGPPVQVVAAS